MTINAFIAFGVESNYNLHKTIGERSKDYLFLILLDIIMSRLLVAIV